MFRKLILAASLLAVVAPAHAQTKEKLTSGAWTCWMTSLVGDPGVDTNLAFNPDGSLDGWFLFEIPEGGDTIGIELAIYGSWTLAGSVISSNVTATEVLGGSMNGEAFTEAEVASMGEMMAEELSSFSGESTIAYLAEHAMVLDEPESSISCWR